MADLEVPRDDSRWFEILAKGVALLVLREKLREKPNLTRLEQAEFLEGLGLTRPEAATLLGVTVSTLYSLKSRRPKKSSSKEK